MKTPKIKPLGSIVLGKAKKTATKTATGLLLPDSTQKKTSFTEVLDIGPDVIDVKIGSKIAYKLYAEHTIELEGQEYILVEENDILAEVET